MSLVIICEKVSLKVTTGGYVFLAVITFENVFLSVVASGKVS